MAFCSNLRILHGSTVLLDYDDKIDSPPSIDGGQEVQSVGFLRADSSKTFARGNDFHSLEWTATEPVSTAAATAISAFSHAVDLPRTTDTVTILISGQTTRYILKNATVESWSGTWDNKRESKTINISGGELQRTAAEYSADIDTITADSAVLTADTF